MQIPNYLLYWQAFQAENIHQKNLFRSYFSFFIKDEKIYPNFESVSIDFINTS
jgi:hypothetical protein